MRYLFISFLLLFFYLKGVAQIIQQDSLTVDKTQQTIKIPFTLLDTSQSIINEYQIQLLYSENNGKSFSEAKFVSGHAGSQILAKGKKCIIWKYLQDSPDFLGLQTRFKIQATFQPSVLNLGGMGSCLSSLLLPGSGNHKVRFVENKKQWLRVALPVYAFIGTGVILKIRSINTYKQYQNTQDSFSAETLYQKSNRLHQWALGTFLTGATIWLTDITLTALKGLQNQRQKKKILKKNQQMDSLCR